MAHAPKKKVVGEGNSPLRTDTPEFRLIFWICLDAQAGCQDELADGGAKAGEEGVEGLVGRR